MRLDLADFVESTTLCEQKRCFKLSGGVGGNQDGGGLRSHEE